MYMRVCVCVCVCLCACVLGEFFTWSRAFSSRYHPDTTIMRSPCGDRSSHS